MTSRHIRTASSTLMFACPWTSGSLKPRRAGTVRLWFVMASVSLGTTSLISAGVRTTGIHSIVLGRPCGTQSSQFMSQWTEGEDGLNRGKREAGLS